MRLCIPDVLASEGICMLPGWADSPGATLEHDIAMALGLALISARW